MRLLGKPKAAGGNSQLCADDVFSTYLYTGTGAALTITNGIDLAGEGGLVWLKQRNSNNNHILQDTQVGINFVRNSNLTDVDTDFGTAFISSVSGEGFTIGTSAYNSSPNTYASWTFRKAPKFFDVVTYTGDGTSNRQIAHSLGVAPGTMVNKATSNTSNWVVYHKGVGDPTKSLVLNSTNATITNVSLGSVDPTDTYFTVSSGSNTSGYTYVAYLFATLPGISKVGSYTGNGSSQIIDCGFSTGARFILIKRTDSAGDWFIWDSGRGIVAGGDPHLSLNTATAEITTDDSIDPDTSGFIVNQVAATNINVSGATYIYLAIS